MPDDCPDRAHVRVNASFWDRRARLLGPRSVLVGCVTLSGCGVFDYQLGGRRDGAAGVGGGGGAAGLGEVVGTGGVETGDAAGTGGGGGTAASSSGSGGSAGDAGIAGSAGFPEGLIGWASVPDCGLNGTNGGEGGPIVTPTTSSELSQAARADGPAIIRISGTIQLTDGVVQIDTDNKTLIGVDGAQIIGGVRVRGARNVVVQNIKFNGAGTAINVDALEVTNSTCVWLDHCEFFDGGDSNLDIVRGSDLVTVSWSKFYYSTKTTLHRLGSVCGNTTTDTPGKINVTFHHNQWGPNLLEEMPGVRHGKVHIFNNYFSAAGNSYCIGANYMSKLLVQNNFFENVNNPIVFNNDEETPGSGHTAEVVETGNDYSTASGEHVARGVSFEPPYPYALEPAETAKQSVLMRAGSQ